MYQKVAVPQDKLFRLTHMQLVWLAETFLQFRAESPTTCFTPKFLRLCHAVSTAMWSEMHPANISTASK